MKYGILHAVGHSANSVFNEVDPIGHYEPTLVPRVLREAFLSKEVLLNTPDISTPEPPSFEIYWEAQQLSNNNLRKFLIATESPYINLLNCSTEYLRQFKKVFSWYPVVQSLPNVTNILVPHGLPFNSFKAWAERDFFVCMINSNKWKHPDTGNDLYEERVRIIRWYEKHHPESFTLWGYGWKKPVPRKGVLGKLNRNFQSLFFKFTNQPVFPSYKGAVVEKAMILGNSKFCFCYENSSSLDNYITEKIFDSMVWGCVPIYLGAPNIASYVPRDSFIDARNFSNYSDLHTFLASIDEKTFGSMQNKIRLFLESEQATIFSANAFAEKIVKTVLET